MLKYNSIVRDYLKKNLGTRNQYWRIYNKIESKLFTKNILIKGLRIYLTGKIIETKYDDESGEPKSMEITIAKPKANPQGVHFLLNFFEGIVNPQTVQGNLVDSEMYEDMIEEIHLGLNQDIINNMYMWDINEDEADPLINNMITTIRLFLTRTIGNKERESYNQTIRHQESSSISNQKGFSLLTRGGV